MTRAPIAVALDAPNLATVTDWAREVGPFVSTLKVGLEAYLRDGRSAVDAARLAAPDCAIFLDLKLHDIPATVTVAAIQPGYDTAQFELPVLRNFVQPGRDDELGTLDLIDDHRVSAHGDDRGDR